MRKGLKVLAFVIDVLLMPIRTLLGLEIVIAAAILNDVSIADTVKEFFETLMQYPTLLKESAKIIFGEEA